MSVFGKRITRTQQVLNTKLMSAESHFTSLNNANAQVQVASNTHDRYNQVKCLPGSNGEENDTNRK
jgi:hypothetical protein